MAITLDTVRTNKAIRTIAAYVQQYTDEHYQEQWQQEYEELLAAWKKSGERSYTLHLHKFFTPLQKELEQIGLKFAQGLHGDLFQSIENWGPLEFRERCYWIVVSEEQEKALGTLILRFFHSHLELNTPHPPSFIALETTDISEIIKTVNSALVRTGFGTPQQVVFGYKESRVQEGQTAWQYGVELGLADTLTADLSAFNDSLVDSALANWGRYGWELASVASHNGRLMAFFKRPIFRWSRGESHRLCQDTGQSTGDLRVPGAPDEAGSRDSDAGRESHRSGPGETGTSYSPEPPGPC